MGRLLGKACFSRVAVGSSCLTICCMWYTFFWKEGRGDGLLMWSLCSRTSLLPLELSLSLSLSFMCCIDRSSRRAYNNVLWSWWCRRNDTGCLNRSGSANREDVLIRIELSSRPTLRAFFPGDGFNHATAMTSCLIICRSPC